jgi:hypothetical protein
MTMNLERIGENSLLLIIMILSLIVGFRFIFTGKIRFYES